MEESKPPKSMKGLDVLRRLRVWANQTVGPVAQRAVDAGMYGPTGLALWLASTVDLRDAKMAAEHVSSLYSPTGGIRTPLESFAKSPWAKQVFNQAETFAKRKGLPPARITRWHEGDNLQGATSRPHGMYFTLGADSPHSDVGSRFYSAAPNTRNPLIVPSIEAFSERFNRVTANSTGPVSAGISALKALLPQPEYARIMRMSKLQLTDELNRKFPGPNYANYYDAHELREAYAGQLARKLGYDAIIGEDPVSSEFSEYIALTDDAYKLKEK
jgi:hypothetical protein